MGLSFTPAADNTFFQTALDLGSADPQNEDDVEYVAKTHYRGNRDLAIAGIIAAHAAQSGDPTNPVVKQIAAQIAATVQKAVAANDDWYGSPSDPGFTGRVKPEHDINR